MKHLKITSVVLSAVMCMSMFATPVSVFADETPADPETQTEAAEKQESEATEKPAPKETEKEEPEETVKEEPEAEEKKEPEQTAEPAETEPSESEPEAKEPSETEPSEENGEPAQTEEPEEAAAPEETAPQTEEDNRKAADKIIYSGINTYGVIAVIYELDDKGKLTLKGEGVVPKQLFGDETYVDQVKSIVFASNKLTGLANDCFYEFKNLKSIKIPGYIKSIGDYAFRP